MFSSKRLFHAFDLFHKDLFPTYLSTNNRKEGKMSVSVSFITMLLVVLFIKVIVINKTTRFILFRMKLISL